MTTQTNQKGFTIIELLIVIVVIGILATITAIALGGANERARDAKRESDVKSLQTALEAYYTIGNATYPTEADFVNPGSFRDDNFQGLDDSVFQDPNADDGVMATTPTQGQYAYEGVDCDANGCAGYTLSVYLEGEEEYLTRTNLQ